jgi:PIN domain nuclease of toxin-antitoxin system
MDPADEVVLDASAILTWLAAEPGEDYVDPLLNGGLISAVNLGEVLYKVAEHGSDPAEIAEDLVGYGLRTVPFGAAQAALLPALRTADRATRVDAPPGRPRRGIRHSLSLADLCCLALACERQATVVTGDRHWLTLDLPVAVVDFRDP